MTEPSRRLEGFFGMLRALPGREDAEALYGPDAAGRRRERNLRRYLSMPHAPILLLGEAPGWRGMAITGVPFVSAEEAESGVVPGLELPASLPARWEASSRAVWAALAEWDGPLPLSWPVVPLHPCVRGSPRTNRTPRRSEVLLGAPVAMELISALGIGTVLAVGRHAQRVAAEAGVAAPALRHPAHGGAALFAQQLSAVNRTLTG